MSPAKILVDLIAGLGWTVEIKFHQFFNKRATKKFISPSHY